MANNRFVDAIMAYIRSVGEVPNRARGNIHNNGVIDGVHGETVFVGALGGDLLSIVSGRNSQPLWHRRAGVEELELHARSSDYEYSQTTHGQFNGIGVEREEKTCPRADLNSL